MTNLAMLYENYICRIASTCQLSCNVNITPHRINIKSHNFAMFSPATAAAILNRRNQNCGQEEQSSSVNSNRRTSPRLQHAAAHARGSSSSQGLLSGGTAESRRGGGTNTNTAPTPSRRLPFGSVDWETPAGTYSVSSISHSTNSPRRRSTVATDPPPAAKRAKRTPNATEGKGSSLYDADDGGDKYDNDDDFIPATNGPILTTAQDAVDDMFIAEKTAELIEKHRQEFTKRAFSVRTLATDVPLTTASASIKMCRPQKQKDIDYIIYTLKNWRVGANIKLMEPCPEKESISKFRRGNHNGSMSSSMSLRTSLFLDPTRLAQYSDGWRAALLAGLLYPERRCLTALMSGTEIMVTWVRRGLGGIAKKNIGMLHRLLSSITARPALLA